MKNGMALIRKETEFISEKAKVNSFELFDDSSFFLFAFWFAFQ